MPIPPFPTLNHFSPCTTPFACIIAKGIDDHEPSPSSFPSSEQVESQRHLVILHRAFRLKSTLTPLFVSYLFLSTLTSARLLFLPAARWSKERYRCSQSVVVHIWKNYLLGSLGREDPKLRSPLGQHYFLWQCRPLEEGLRFGSSGSR